MSVAAYGPTSARLMIVGEAERSRPFVGYSGQCASAGMRIEGGEIEFACDKKEGGSHSFEARVTACLRLAA